MKITAILVVRNEEDYIERTIQFLIENAIDLAIIDNESTDGTPAICRKYYPKRVKAIVNLPYHGVFELQRHVAAGMKLLSDLDTDWVISHAADERFFSDRPGESLRDAIVRVAALGCDVINLDEFVFVYEDDRVDYRGTDICRSMRYYYFFETYPRRLMRIFKKGVSLQSFLAGVHQMPEEKINLYNGNFFLRHYPALSYACAQKKYLSRVFSKKELEIGLHNNRVTMTAENLKSPGVGRLLRMASDDSLLMKSNPCASHFWEW